jgi:hypothetical protein
MPFRTLDPAQILATAERLEARISERFPDRGLALVAREVVALSRSVTAEVQAPTPPLWWLRGLVGLVVLAGGAVFVWVGSLVPLNQVGRETIGSVQGIEAAINTALLAGFGLLALVRLEARVKRSVIHVIDMHQLTKDPVALLPDFHPTATSPKRDMDAVALSRYLDYCSELLAITGKLAALYAQAVPEEGVASAVNDIEVLGASLSRKIWQKITLIDSQSRKPQGRKAAKLPE